MSIKALEKNTRTRKVIVRMNDKEYKTVKTAAEAYADGNLSAWFRYAASELVPTEDGESSESAQSVD